jgi:N-acetylglucosaminyl-diphospho-decaprenol L-rhamnosyltransferase
VTSVALVVVTHDTRDEVLGCLAGIDPAELDDAVVVDCGSRDGTVDAVRAAEPTVRLVELANAGFGRGANAGVRRTTAEVVVVANADVRFPPGALRGLAGTFDRDPSIGAVGPTVVYPDGTLQASARTLPDLSTAVGHALLGRWWPGNPWTRRYRAVGVDPARAREVDWLSGCALALRRTAFDAVDGFDPGYFLYVEDVDLGVRLRAAGWRLVTEPSVTVVHRVGASTRSHRLRALIAHARGLERFALRHVVTGRWRRWARLPLRFAATSWVGLTWLWERTLGVRASTTGERIAGAGDAGSGGAANAGSDEEGAR